MIITQALVGVEALGIETAPFIYYVENHPKYGDKMQAIFELVESREIAILTSVVTLTETLTKPIKVGDTVLEQAYPAILENTYYLTLLAINPFTAEQAARLRAKYNLKTPDALQVAAALGSGCDAFLTNDMGLKRVDEIRILILDELEIDPPKNT